MSDLEGYIDQVAAETGFSGVVRVDRSGRMELAKGVRVGTPRLFRP